MKQKKDVQDWGQRYGNALRAFLRKGVSSDVKPAARLGRQAAVLGLETLDVARVHEEVLCATTSSAGGAHARAQRFFAETLVPIERTHEATRKAEVRVKELTRTLHVRQRETTTSKRKLKRGIARRKSVEAASRDVDLDRARLLKESHKLQRRLRYRLRQLMVMQEEGREKNGRQFRNDIAQTLLAIDVRLLALKEAGMADINKLSKEIAETEDMVRQCIQTLTRLAHDNKT